MKISIITPSFNQGAFIERTIRSVANQHFSQLEHFVVDGGSTDNTVEILQQQAAAVQWLSEPDHGQAHAVNKGIDRTSGEIIGWLNSDDVYYPGALTEVSTYFERNPTVDVVYGRANHIDIMDQAIDEYEIQNWDRAKLRQICFICQPATFFRRRVIEKVGLLDESLNYCMDYEFWLRLSESDARFAFLDMRLAGSRMYPQNKTLGARMRVHIEINDMLKRKFGRVPLRWVRGFYQVVAEETVGSNRPLAFRIAKGLALMYAVMRWGVPNTKLIEGEPSVVGPQP